MQSLTRAYHLSRQSGHPDHFLREKYLKVSKENHLHTHRNKIHTNTHTHTHTHTQTQTHIYADLFVRQHWYVTYELEINEN